MSEKYWILNKKAFAALRAIQETHGSKETEKWAYLHVGPRGCTATDTMSLIRVGLPPGQSAKEARIFDYETAQGLIPKKADVMVEMPEGLEAKTTGQFIVPNHEAVIPDPKDQTATVTINAKYLVSILKAAIEVSEHSRSLVRLRFYDNKIRIDAHRDKGGQEFMAILLGTNYNGDCIPGDVPEGTATQKAPVKNETNEQHKLNMPILEGRKFRE